MLPADVSLLRTNILSVQQCFSILLKKNCLLENREHWTGSTEHKKYNMLYLLSVFKHYKVHV